jgi:hypothetical protein
MTDRQARRNTRPEIDAAARRKPDTRRKPGMPAPDRGQRWGLAPGRSGH